MELLTFSMLNELGISTVIAILEIHLEITQLCLKMLEIEGRLQKDSF